METGEARSLHPLLVGGGDGDQKDRRFWRQGPKLLEDRQTIEIRHFPVQDGEIEGKHSL